MAGLTLPITCSLASLSCLPLLLWRSVVSGAMLLPIIFIMAFPGDIMKHGLIIHQTKYFIFMLLNSRAAACLQFIWVMVCIPNHRDLVFLCAVKASMQKSIMSLKLGFFSFFLQLMHFILPEAAVAVQISITGVTSKAGILVTDAAPRKLFFVTVWRLMSISSR